MTLCCKLMGRKSHLLIVMWYLIHELINISLNSLYTGGLFHCYILDKFICQVRGVGSILSLLSLFFYGKSRAQLFKASLA